MSDLDEQALDDDQRQARDVMLCETVAGHFPDAHVDREAFEVALGFGDVAIRCRVNNVGRVGELSTASLFFYLRGGGLGQRPIFASMSGYGESIEHAIIGGGCQWCCTFGPVLRAGLGGERQEEATELELAIDGHRFLVFVAALDRAFSSSPDDVKDRMEAARARFAGAEWLTRMVLGSGRLPLLAADRPSLLSVFVGHYEPRVVEVKVDGLDWPGVGAAFAHLPWDPAYEGVLMRELAVATPIGAPPLLARAPVERTLRGLAERAAAAGVAAWPGARHHGHALAPPIDDAELAALERRIGALPTPYRNFLATVGESGAGPGYGLLSPRRKLTVTLAHGDFDWEDGASPSGSPRGVLCLAHAGCGLMWLLVLRGRRGGEVWVDSRSSDRAVHRCAASFDEWYRAWLCHRVRDGGPWIQWDHLRCSPGSVLSNVIDDLQRAGIADDALYAEVEKRLEGARLTTTSDGSDYFASGTSVNPCEGCVSLVQRISPSVLLEPGRELPLEGEPAISTPDPPRSGWFVRLCGRLRGG
jgi:hypothetical protein